jgi:signal transduction histidine kinase
VDAALNEVPRYGIVELTLPKQNGDTTILEVATTRVKSLDWKQLGVILTIKDITEPKKTEEIIRRMDRYSSLGQLSAGIAHEIRNPLASINFNIQLLSMELPLNDQQRRLFADMSVCVDRIKILVKSMLDFAKPSPPEFNRGRIEKVLDHCIGMMHAQIQKRRIRLDVQIDGNIPEITFDSHQIEQVFINILLNAMEAVPEGGDIIIRLKPKLNASDGKSYIVVSMRDTGGGILSEHMPRIFDPFFTTKPDGTGLGLSIVHKILEQHHSTIEVSSDPQGGTTVTLKFTTDDMKR